MISCDECQKKIVAGLDSEGSKDDERLIEEHLKDCPYCRAFRDDMLRIRQQFVSVAMPSLSVEVRQGLMHKVRSDSQPRENRNDGNPSQRLSIFARFPRMTWAAGLAALLLIAASWIVSFSLARKVQSLKREMASSRQELALAKEKEHLEEAQERQQKAISALYFRMQELEQRVERSGPPRSAYLPSERNGL